MGAIGLLNIQLYGRFRIEGPGREDLTPRGAKDCGLIALLATSPHGERSRSWLQSKLWSDRGAEQAAGSLRQAVAKVRKSLGAHKETLYSNRQCVGLNMNQVVISTEPGLEFLEGIDVRDEEFEYWLTTQRAAQDDVVTRPEETPARQNVQAPDTVVVCFEQGIGASSETDWAKQMIGDMINRSIAETFDVCIRQDQDGLGGVGVWKIDVDCVIDGCAGMQVRLAITDTSNSRILWSVHRALDSQSQLVNENKQVISLVQELTRAFGSHLLETHPTPLLSTRPDALCYLGVHKLFSMEASSIADADILFRKAFEHKPRGLYLAWRAHVREIQLVERLKADQPALREESESLVRRAFDMEPNNSMVLALLAINRLHVADEVEAALQFARRAVRANYGNAMAWWALSAVHLKSGNPVKSYGCARVAADFALGTPLEFWTQSQLAGAAMAMRKLSEAKAVLKNVNFARPDFRPPLRYLLALHATDEEWESAVAASERLKILEPGFSIDRLANDRDYPVSLLHQPYGLDATRVLSLI